MFLGISGMRAAKCQKNVKKMSSDLFLDFFLKKGYTNNHLKLPTCSLNNSMRLAHVHMLLSETNFLSMRVR